MASTNTKPSYIPTPFANGGQKNTIPVNDQGNYLASWTMGFPAVTSTPLAQGGLPPDRLDVNGALNVLSGFIYYLQLGGYFTYDANLASAITGYPKDMVLGYVDSTHGFMLLRSTKNNNQDNFVSNPSFIGTSWVKDTPTMADLTTRVPASIGSSVKPVYTNANGTITASNATVGSSTQPVYMNGGSMTACTSYASFLSNWARNGWSTKTLLTSGPQGGGDITLSQPYTNFDALMVIIETDDYTANTINILTQSDITYLMSLATSWTLGLGAGSYWSCLPSTGGSTSTLFKTGGSHSENCVVYQIYGVNF